MDSGSIASFKNYSVVYSYTPPFFVTEEDNIDLVLITREGLILETFEEKIVRSCRLLSEISYCTNLKLFYNYELSTKYYLILAEEKLFVVEKNDLNELKLQQTIQNASEVTVEDSNDLGKPAVKIRDKNGQENLVDLYIGVSYDYNEGKPKTFGSATLKLISEIQAMEERLNSAKKVLDQKRAFVTKREKLFTIHENNEIIVTESEIVPSMNIYSDNLMPPSVLQGIDFVAGKPWLRICDEFWIIGVQVYNPLDRPLKSFTMSILNNLSDEQEYIIEFTTVYQLPESPGTANQVTSVFSHMICVEEMSSAYVVGVMKGPEFIRSKINLSLMLFCSPDERKDQRFVGNIEVDPADLLTDKFSLFNNEIEVEDMISFVACSSEARIPFLMSEENGLELVDSAFLQLGFKKINANYYVNDFESDEAMAGILVNVLNEFENELFLTVYYRYKQQCYNFLERLKVLLRPFCTLDWRIDRNIKELYQSLVEELDLLRTACNLVVPESLEIPIDRNLTKLILDTERKINLLYGKQLF